jgi:hypothetical protein
LGEEKSREVFLEEVRIALKWRERTNVPEGVDGMSPVAGGSVKFKGPRRRAL